MLLPFCYSLLRWQLSLLAFYTLLLHQRKQYAEGRIENQKFNETMSGKKALVIVSQDAEEMEVVIAVDVLRRAYVDVTLAGLNGANCIRCSNGITLCPDIALKQVLNNLYDAIIITGGQLHAENLAQSPLVGSMLKRQEGRKAYIAVMSPDPVVLRKHGVCAGKVISGMMSSGDGFKYSGNRVVVDGCLLTSRGAANTYNLILTLVRLMLDEQTAENVRQDVVTQLCPDIDFKQ